MKHKLMAAIRKASLEYRARHHKNPKNVYLPLELAKLLVNKNWVFTKEEGATGFMFTNNHCTLDIHLTPKSLGRYFNCVGDEKDYLDAVAEHMLLTESNSPMEERRDEKNSDRSSNVVSMFSGGN